MDYQNRVGSKPGAGGVMSASESNVDRRERLRKLALETIDLAKDPYFMRNHIGSYECKLCLTIHTNEGSYLAHTQGKKHQTNLARRAALDEQDSLLSGTPINGQMMGGNVKRVGNLMVQMDGSGGLLNQTRKLQSSTIKIGRPGYKVVKIRDPASRQVGFCFQLQLSEISPDRKPHYRFMSAFEQKIELPPNKFYQYLLVAADPYETIAFKIQNKEIDMRPSKFITHWDIDTKIYTLQFLYLPDTNQTIDYPLY
ncbi:Pre-mRNA-splicing factor sap62 [Smittium culicis]|uniref:Pre-mRNA-splicing factor sap62 n=1 Tax=Smittium culicis TaxID=133412 RepID=A0A1R1Y9K1_9FUNG|nr:Pre-mRNA-splicing factor sap62 [Smittium culicis]